MRRIILACQLYRCCCIASWAKYRDIANTELNALGLQRKMRWNTLVHSLKHISYMSQDAFPPVGGVTKTLICSGPLGHIVEPTVGPPVHQFAQPCFHGSPTANGSQRLWTVRFYLDGSPCCLVFDGTGMLLNSLTSLTLSTERKETLVRPRQDTWRDKTQKRGLTSCPSWAWRCTASAFRCTEGWTSSGGTWGDMRSGPAGSERQESREHSGAQGSVQPHASSAFSNLLPLKVRRY